MTLPSEVRKLLSADEGDYEPRFTETEPYVVLLPDDSVVDDFRIVSNFTPTDIVPRDTSVLHKSSAELRRLHAALTHDTGTYLRNTTRGSYSDMPRRADHGFHLPQRFAGGFQSADGGAG